MSKHDSGGPAFPAVAENGLGHVCDGMTLRDYFAARAMTVLMSQMEVPATDQVAQWAYKQADAMLAARKESQS